MTDEINLPKTVNGTELLDLIEKAALKLGWKCRRYVEKYSVSPGSAKVKPAEYNIDILIGRFIKERVWTGFKPDEQYSYFHLYGDSLGQKRLEMFASTLYGLLGQ
jgi:hypothetical protein